MRRRAAPDHLYVGKGWSAVLWRPPDVGDVELLVARMRDVPGHVEWKYYSHDGRQPRGAGARARLPLALLRRAAHQPADPRAARIRPDHHHDAVRLPGRLEQRDAGSVAVWTSADSEATDSRSRLSASGAWGCRSSTERPTRARRSRRSTGRSSSESTSSIPRTCTAAARTRSSS